MFKTNAERHGAGKFLKSAEPIVTLVFPITAGIVVLYPHRGHVFWILKTEFGWNADLDRKTVGGGQSLVIEFESQLGLRMQRGRHVDGVGIALGALEPDIFSRRVGTDQFKEVGQFHALPGADGAPAFDANKSGDLRDFGQAVEFGKRPRLFVLNEPADLKLIGLAVDIRRFVQLIIAIEREWPRDRAFRNLGRERRRAEQQRLDAVVEARYDAQRVFGGRTVNDVAAGQRGQRAEAGGPAQK